MAAPRTVVKVDILGEEFSIRSEASPERTVAVAAHVDKTIRQILAGGSISDARKAAILAALQITDELMQTREGASDLTSSLKRLSAEIRPWLPPAKRRD
jgi:cell division protein ZapA